MNRTLSESLVMEGRSAPSTAELRPFYPEGLPMEWLRLYTEITRDPKLRRLPAEHRWTWIACLCIARRSPRPGYLLLAETLPAEISDIADEAAVPVEDVTRAIETFQCYGMLFQEGAIFRIAKWDKRQFEGKSSTERVRRHREKQRNAVEMPATKPHPASNDEDSGTEEKDSGGVAQGIDETFQKRFPPVPETPPEYRLQNTENDYYKQSACKAPVTPPDPFASVVVVSLGEKDKTPPAPDDSLSQLLELIPPSHRTEYLREKVRDFLEDKGQAYVRRNILYANSHAKQDYRAYLGQSLNRDWGKSMVEDLAAQEEREKEVRKALEAREREEREAEERYRQASERFASLHSEERQRIVEEVKRKNPLVRIHSFRPETLEALAIKYLEENHVAFPQEKRPQAEGGACVEAAPGEPAAPAVPGTRDPPRSAQNLLRV
ncbi:phage replisome organizer N-terminal domain-containing protein [Desulforhabdus sp. TSK]|uniref:phage replisome organizer N-terminal domain-containing protein n=1 Tax=Desulforhabdus sp. TSK TaxID=2925014 RepID=UPI001FC8CB00|nr:phage replisome organizer N-terminal domain-containing protein [Desulforhabdus sp. TSK]